jgi:hypothetical protein
MGSGQGTVGQPEHLRTGQAHTFEGAVSARLYWLTRPLTLLCRQGIKFRLAFLADGIAPPISMRL